MDAAEFDEHITGDHVGSPLQIYVLFIICLLVQNRVLVCFLRLTKTDIYVKI